MIVGFLADSASGAAIAGRIVGALIFPAAGLTLLIVGLRSRAAARRRWAPSYPPAYAQPPGYPPGFPGYPPPMPRPPNAGTGLIVTGIVLLVLGAFGIVGSAAFAASRHSARMSIGDCFTNEILDGSRWKSQSCTNAEAVLEYAATTDASGNCPDGKLTNSGYLSLERDGIRRCFVPNLLENRCYKSERDDETVRVVNCATAGKVIRVVKRIDGAADTSACPADAHGVSFPEPRRTYCTERMAETI